MARLKKYLANGLLMTVVALLLRTVTVSFNVYISNKIGAEALGLFTLIGSVYSFALTLATSGINLTSTRMVSDALGRGDHGGVRRAMVRCIIYALFFGFLASFLLFVLAEPIGLGILKDKRTISPLRIFSISLPLIALSSSLNGYFTAMRRVYKNAVVQVYEQFIKIVACVIFLELIFAKDIESSCIALILGGVLAEISSCALAIILYVWDKKKHLQKKKYLCTTEKTTRKMLSISLPLAFSAYFRSALLTIEHILIPMGLQKNGANRASALASYGILQGMVLPVVLFPAAFIQSFAGLLIPELAELNVQKNDIEIKYIASRSSQIALIFSVGVAAVMFCFSGELGSVIYNSEEAGKYIRVLALIIPIMYLDTTVDSMLKGLGQQLYTMNVNIIDSMCSVIMVQIFIPVMGIYGYVLLIMISEMFNFSLSLFKLLKISKMRMRIGKWVLKPLLSAVGATAFSSLIFKMLYIPQGYFSLVLHIAVCIALYLVFVCLFGALDNDDICWIKNFLRK